MGKLIDLTGKKFGRLTVTKRVRNNKWNRAMWLCKCECGNETTILGNSLGRGDTKSCGCLHREQVGERYKLNPGLASMRSVIGNYRKNAKKKGLEYNLTEEQFRKLTQQPCYYCGALPNNVFNQKRCNGAYKYNGLDRIDNVKGYTIDNVVSCCRMCNMAKNNNTLQEFRNWVLKVYNHMYKEDGKKELKVVKTITVKIKAKDEEQITWAMMIFRPMIKQARRDIIEDGLEINMEEE